MTVEEKAKAYDEAIRKAKITLGCCNSASIATKNTIYDIFPELNPELEEDEDKRIRKELKHYLDVRRCLTTDDEEYITCNHFIAWLEKQSEVTKTSDQEPEPKFHEHEWIIHQGTENIYQVIARIDNQYQLKYGDNYTIQKCADVDRCARLWTIQDAKDGDVLANDHHILILKESVYDWYTNGTPYSVKAYCGIKPNGNFEIGKDNWSFCGTIHIHPATKEQRDLLFQKMADAGYEWDADKKELKKIKVANNENKDERMKREILELVSISGIDYNQYEEIKDWLEKQNKQKQIWKPNTAQLIVIKDLIEDKNTSNLNKAILRNMLTEFKKDFGLC